MNNFKAGPGVRWLLLVTAVVASSGLLFSIAEAGIRLRHYLKYGTLQRIEDTYAIDPKSGLRIPIPGSSMGGIRINSMGFRSPELGPKSQSTVRIAFIGSSTTYCLNVPSNEDTWPHLVARELQAQWPDVRVDYINAGVMGYSAANSLQNLKLRVGPLAPDIIVIYEGHNDLSGNAFDLARSQGIVSKQTEQTLSWPARYSLLWYLVEKNLMILANQRTSRETRGKLVFDEAAVTTPFHRDLETLVENSKRVASVVALATLSTQFRSDQSPEQQTRAAVTSLYYMPYMSIPDLLQSYHAYNEVVRQVAENTSSTIIGEENSIPGDTRDFADSIHFTTAGSHAMAERVTHGLLQSADLKRLLSYRSAIGHVN